MMQGREKPDYSSLRDYNYAVAGHAGTMCDADGCMFVKPCTQREIDFYETARAQHPDFYGLMPEYMGVVALSTVAAPPSQLPVHLPVILDSVSEEVKSHILEAAAANASSAPAVTPNDGITWIPTGGKKIQTDLGICLENATFGYKRPNILDVKLGVRLWADDAPLQKKQRFDQISASTTHKALGFRIAGMRTYKGSDKKEELDEEQYKIYSKDYGKRDVNTENVFDAFRAFIFNKAAGIDEQLGRAVAAVFLENLKHVKDTLECEESRMYSSSLLFVFEGDGDALRCLIDEHNAGTVVPQRRFSLARSSRSVEGIDSGIDMTEENDGAISESEDDFTPKPWVLRLIDFAHAEFVPGLGPDENNLKGVQSLIDIFSQLAE